MAMYNFTAQIAPALVAVLTFASILLIAISLPGMLQIGIVGRFRNKKLKQMEEWHKNLFVSSRSPEEHIAWLEWGSAIVFLLCAVLSRNVLLAVILVVLIWQIPKYIYWHFAKKRTEKFDEHLPVVLDQLTSATRAGKSLSQAINDVSSYAPFPISQEFTQISSDQKLGIDLSTALKSARKRIGSKPFSLAVTAMLVNTDLGGNLPNTMKVMSDSLKEIWRLDQKLHTSSAEGRKGGFILAIMPIVILCIVMLMQPDMITTLFSSVIGYIVLIAAVLTYLGGLFWMYRILQVDI